jgi:NADH:ubiquinone oxidoreductase subunit F (NADH-binding)
MAKAPSNSAAQRVRKKVRKNVADGIAHVHASFNNTIITITDRQGNATTLEDISQVMADASICGLGQAAPNPIRTVLKYFSHEVGGETP